MNSLHRWMLGGLVVLGGAVRFQQSSVDLFLYLGVFVVLLLFVGNLLLKDSSLQSADGQGRGGGKSLRRFSGLLWGTWLLIALYGQGLTHLKGGNIYTGIGLASRFIPFLLIPVFVWSFRTRRQWRSLLQFICGVAGAVALLDLLQWGIGGAAVQRLSGGPFYSVYPLYGLILSLSLLMFEDWKRGSRYILMATLSLCAVRTLLSTARISLVAIGLVLAVGAIIPRHREVAFSRRGVLLVAVLVGLAGIIGFPATNQGGGVVSQYSTRLEYVSASLLYRWVEIQEISDVAGIIGQGWGSEHNLSRAVAFTRSASARAQKSYVHNFPAFLWWKVGALGVGGFFALAYVPIREGVTALKNRTGRGLRLVLVVVLAVWLVHSLVDMNFSRPELNLLVAAFYAYLIAAPEHEIPPPHGAVE